MPEIDALLTGTVHEWVEAATQIEPHANDFLLALDRGEPPDEAAEQWLRQQIVLKAAGNPYREFFKRVEEEVTALVCGGRQYAEQRRHLGAAVAQAKTALIAGVAAAIGSKFGPYSTVILPLVAVVLGLIAQVGANAWCAGRRGA